MCRHPTPPCSACARPSTIEPPRTLIARLPTTVIPLKAGSTSASGRAFGEERWRLHACACRQSHRVLAELAWIPPSRDDVRGRRRRMMAAGPRCARSQRMSDMRPILIAGPTASGKSGLALRLAEHLGGVVINADSHAGVSRAAHSHRPSGAGGGSARPARALWLRARQRELFGRALRGRRGRACSKTRAAKAAVRSSSAARASTSRRSPRGCRPSRRCRRTCARTGARAGGGKGRRAPARRSSRCAMRRWRGRLAPGDTQRVVRALEVIDDTGMSLAEWQRLPREPVLDLADDDPARRRRSTATCSAERIEARFEQMLDEGGARGGSATQGARPCAVAACDAGAGRCARCCAIWTASYRSKRRSSRARLETRQYAKRQRTWMRSNMIAWRAIPTQQMQQSAGDFVSFIQAAH